MKVVEQFIQSKSGASADCEDAIVTCGGFCAVIDGATSTRARLIDGLTPGQKASQLIGESIRQLPEDVSYQEAINIISAHVQRYYKRHGMLALSTQDPSVRLCATLAIYSANRRQVWIVGDCKCAMAGSLYTNANRVDSILANVRSLIMKSELLHGRSVSELRSDDIGREFILPLLELQHVFRNNPSAGLLSYSAIDGYPCDLQRSLCIDVTTQDIALFTDGYPGGFESLGENERYLAEVLSVDPLLIDAHLSTKGLLPNAVSFDDRAFVRLRLP